MYINKKQEVAMWLLGLLWGAGLLILGPATLQEMTAWLIPTFLIIFSLRNRKKRE